MPYSWKYKAWQPLKFQKYTGTLEAHELIKYYIRKKQYWELLDIQDWEKGTTLSSGPLKRRTPRNQWQWLHWSAILCIFQETNRELPRLPGASVLLRLHSWQPSVHPSKPASICLSTCPSEPSSACVASIKVRGQVPYTTPAQDSGCIYISFPASWTSLKPH